jgi:hypothetical protein
MMRHECGCWLVVRKLGPNVYVRVNVALSKLDWLRWRDTGLTLSLHLSTSEHDQNVHDYISYGWVYFATN